MKLKIGDEVKLITKKHGISNNNPYWPDYKKIGTIDRIHNTGGLNIRVVWELGGMCHNVYSSSDLELVDEPIMDVEELFGDIDI